MAEVINQQKMKPNSLYVKQKLVIVFKYSWLSINKHDMITLWFDVI